MALILFLTSLEYQVKPDYVAIPYTSDNLLPTSGRTPLKMFHWNKAHTSHEPVDNLDFLLTSLGFAACQSKNFVTLVFCHKGKHYISFLDAENSTFTTLTIILAALSLGSGHLA